MALTSREGDYVMDLCRENESLKAENKRLLEHIEVLKGAIEHLNQVKNDIELGRCPF
jgi:hypothetical protein